MYWSACSVLNYGKVLTRSASILIKWPGSLLAGSAPFTDGFC